MKQYYKHKSQISQIGRCDEGFYKTYIFPNGNRFRVEPMNHIIYQHQIIHSVHISFQAKVLGVISSKSNLSKTKENRRPMNQRLTSVKAGKKNVK